MENPTYLAVAKVKKVGAAEARATEAAGVGLRRFSAGGPLSSDAGAQPPLAPLMSPS